jgi:hypothetical protein
MFSLNRRSPLTTKIVGLVALTLASVGGTGIAMARSANAKRGIVDARGPITKLVVAGPIALHAYSQYAGGSLYVAQAVTGTDRDCQVSASATPIEADRIATFKVGAGQVACLKTTTTETFELLWHAVDHSVPAVILARANH